MRICLQLQFAIIYCAARILRSHRNFSDGWTVRGKSADDPIRDERFRGTRGKFGYLSKVIVLSLLYLW